jgi:hypothetical protein
VCSWFVRSIARYETLYTMRASGASGPVGAKSSAECGCNQKGYTDRVNAKTYVITFSQFPFYIDGERRPVLKLYTPGTYKFDQSDVSNDGHLIRLRMPTETYTIRDWFLTVCRADQESIL